jgi:hypothetical protein
MLELIVMKVGMNNKGTDPLLSGDSVNSGLCSVMSAMIELLFSTWSVPKGYQWHKSGALFSCEQWPAGNGVSAEAEESSLLETVTR